MTVDALTLLVYALATWRVSSMVSEEMGPWDVFDRIRTAAGVQYDPYGQVHESTGPFGKQLSCLWCVSPFVGLGWTLAHLWWPGTAGWVALPFALSAAAVMVNARGVRSRKRVT